MPRNAVPKRTRRQRADITKGRIAPGRTHGPETRTLRKVYENKANAEKFVKILISRDEFEPNTTAGT